METFGGNFGETEVAAEQVAMKLKNRLSSTLLPGVCDLFFIGSTTNPGFIVPTDYTIGRHSSRIGKCKCKIRC